MQQTRIGKIASERTQAEMQEKKTKETTDANFKKDVLDSDIPVMVDFWAPWCEPCRVMNPIIDRINEKMSGKAKVFKINVDENIETCDQYGITGIPTVIIFKNGQIDKEFVGVQSEEIYLNALQNSTN